MTFNAEELEARYRDTVKCLKFHVEKFHRHIEEIQLVAVSKRHSAENIAALSNLGHRDFAENYLQDALSKQAEVAQILGNGDSSNNLAWHFIGHIQSRKSKQIAENFDWVHTVESIKVANKLSEHRTGSPLNILIQLNLQQEESKSGISIDRLPELADQVAVLPNLKLRGLMIIPKPESEFEHQRTVFKQCREILEDLNSRGHTLDQLSMGMTEDMEAAVAEGSTMVRIGTAIFGKRPE